MAEFLLPDVGEGLTEAEIVSWKVKVGDTVEINDIVVEIETAKSLVELPSPYAGTVTGLLVPEGEMVPVGTPIIAIGDPDEAPADGARRLPAPTEVRDGDRPLQPARQRRRRGREPGRPQQGRPRCRPSRAEDRRVGAACPPEPPLPTCRPRGPSSPVPPRRGGRRRAGRPGDVRPHGHRGGAGRGSRPCQAAGPQARQGPRRRHHHADPDRAPGHGHPGGRRGCGFRRRNVVRIGGYDARFA